MYTRRIGLARLRLISGPLSFKISACNNLNIYLPALPMGAKCPLISCLKHLQKAERDKPSEKLRFRSVYGS